MKKNKNTDENVVSVEKNLAKKKVIDIISIMPEYFFSPLSIGLIDRGIKNGIVEINILNPRDFASDKHRRVDDRIYGGGAGQLLMGEPIVKAYEFANERNFERFGALARQTVIMSPSGKLLNSAIASEMAVFEHLIVICGRYEGIDARVAELTDAIEISIGNYILSGGEIASLVFIETVCRFYEGFLGNFESLSEESFNGLKDEAEVPMLEYPQYTTPRVLRGKSIPNVLIEGNHKLIKEWRLKKSIEITGRNRPDLSQISKQNKLKK